MEQASAAAPAQLATPAPAQPTAPVPTTAREKAIVEGNFSAFRAATRAEKVGKPLPAPEAEAATPNTPADPNAPPVVAQPERQVSKRQQQINDYERTIAEQHERIRALEDKVNQPPASRAAAAPAASTTTPTPAPVTVKDFERYLAMPDAPKLEEFSDLTTHNAAMSVFIADKRYEERQAADRQRTAEERQAAAEQERYTSARTRFEAFSKTDPTFVQRLSDEVLTLKTFAQLKPGEKGGPLNAIAEELIDSPVQPQLLLHFSEHPEELQRLASIQNAKALIREFGRLQERFEQAAPPEPHTRTVSAAPPPPVTVGSRSSAAPADAVKAALKSGDFGAFRRAKREQLAASRK